MIFNNIRTHILPSKAYLLTVGFCFCSFCCKKITLGQWFSQRSNLPWNSNNFDIMTYTYYPVWPSTAYYQVGFSIKQPTITLKQGYFILLLLQIKLPSMYTAADMLPNINCLYKRGTHELIPPSMWNMVLPYYQVGTLEWNSWTIYYQVYVTWPNILPSMWKSQHPV